MKTRKKATRERSGLRERIIQAASKVFVEEGYGNLSMRRVAQEVGCSQMAMYRHFANKEALTQHLCAQLYAGFTARMYSEMDASEKPSDRLRILITGLIRFAAAYPDHYSLIFLVRHPDPEVIAEREQLGQEFIKDIRAIVQELLPAETPLAVVDTRLQQMLTCLHGTAALLIAHPRSYGLTQQRAIVNTEATFSRLLERTVSF